MDDGSRQPGHAHPPTPPRSALVLAAMPLPVVNDHRLSLTALGLYATALAEGGSLDVAWAARRPGENVNEVLDAVTELVHARYADLRGETLTLTDPAGWAA